MVGEINEQWTPVRKPYLMVSLPRDAPLGVLRLVLRCGQILRVIIDGSLVER